MKSKARKREIIMKTALELFITNGFHGTPTSLIAKKSGVANGTLFNYFKTKDILINEIFLEVKSKQTKAVFKDYEEGGGLKTNLKSIWDNLVKWGLEHRSEKKFIESYNDSYLITEITKEEIKKNYETLTNLIEQYLEKKDLNGINTMMFILNFVGASLFTLKYFEVIEKGNFDRNISDSSFERFCKGVELTDED